MLSIGQFSKICSVTKKTLRYYDEIGLLRSACVGENGYRYYAINQMKQMIFINRLKGYGASLEEIQIALADESEEVLLTILKKKEQELNQTINEQKMMIERLRFDMANLERGYSIMAYVDALEVKLVERESQNILSSRQEMSVEEFGKYISGLFERVAKEQLTMTGRVMSIYHGEDFNPLKSDIEVAVPVQEVAKGTRDLPGGLHAMITHQGAYSDLTGAYAKLTEWISTEGYQITNMPFEVYLTDIGQNPAEHITEIYFPVKKK